MLEYDGDDTEPCLVSYDWLVTDHLGSVRAIAGMRTGSTGVKEVNGYLPFGTRLPGTLQSSGNRHRFGGKEEQRIGSTDLKLLDFGARYYDAFSCRWTVLDPLAWKYPAITPYSYCAGNPVNLVDPEGKEIGDKETILFGLHHPIIALKVGKVSHNKTNISTNSTRFADTGEVLYGSRPREQEERGSEAGAFRHTLWQATITSRYNAKIAKQIGDAHEIDPKNVDFNNLTYSSIDEADKSVDLMNNQIGRAIGESLDPSYGMLSIALKVLYYYNDNGLYTASQTSEGTWVINKTKLSDDKTKQLTLLFLNLDNNGFSISE